ncbi:nucleoside hydrolase [Mycetocola lacteus]|uniref:nucleoside hydrolase n=1 Tax=Mycetocola lacteus TaxID=76637 RepID=UPI001C7D9762|nr:nucleoside hydrolase [Mycetocola lacteus]
MSVATHPIAEPFFLDCDTGIDDCLAIAYLIGRGVNLVGVGTVSGNTSAAEAAENTARFLGALGRTDIPIAVGAHNPLDGVFAGTVAFVHGENGIGDVDLPAVDATRVDTSAAQLLVDLARQNPGTLKVLAIGPLTNLAIAFALEPRLPELIGELTIMGGAALAPGNATAAAEANIYKDPVAAHTVLTSGFNTILVPLDVTMEHTVGAAEQERLSASTQPGLRAIGAMLDTYLDFYIGVYGERRASLHDALAAAIATGDVSLSLAPEASVVVETGRGPARGQTVVDLRGRYRNYALSVSAGALSRVVLEVPADAADTIMTVVERIDAPAAPAV